MKNMLRMASLCTLLAASSLSAVEVGLLLDKQFGKAKAASAVSEYEAVKPGGMGFRVGVGLLDLKVAELGAAFTYHPKAKDDLVFRTGVPGVDIRGDYEAEYMALGVQADWKFLVNLHAGVDIRREKYTTSYSGGGAESTDVTRPWIKAGIGFSIPTPILSPFVRLEVAVAAAKTDKMNNGDEVRKTLAPNYQIGIYGGIRF